jgi:GNAT superfamily N-acetyltransferase
MSRTFLTSDLPALLALVESAHWNQTAADWERLIALCGKKAVGIEVEGKIVSSATLLPHGSQAAWLGMVLTLPDHQRRGYAKQLLTQLIASAPQEQTIYLDATSQGQPLYEQLGFVAEQVVHRWTGTAYRTEEGASGGAWNGALDREAFGADRSPLLREFGRDSLIWQTEDGSFAMRRPGRNRTYLGPVVARSKSSAERLVMRALHGAGEVYWDIFESNREAVALAAGLGFNPQRRLVRMRRGKALEAKTALQFGIAGFEYG